MKAAIWLRVLMLEQREYRTDAETFAAIDLDAAAGDECRAFTEQPDDRRTDLGFLAQTLERRLTCELGNDFLGKRRIVMIHATGLHITGGNRIDAHTGSAPLDRRRLGEIQHAGARRTAVAHARHAAPHAGPPVDDHTPVLSPPH